MKPINFLKTVPPKRQKEVRMWVATSLLSIGGLILFMFLIFGAQFYFLIQTRDQCKLQQGCPVDDSLFRTKKALLEHKTTLDTLIKKQEQLTRLNHKKIGTLQTVCSSCSPQFQIKAVRMHKKEIEITGVTKENQSVHTLVANLSNKVGVRLTVQSINTHGDGVSFIAKGSLL